LRRWLGKNEDRKGKFHAWELPGSWRTGWSPEWVRGARNIAIRAITIRARFSPANSSYRHQGTGSSTEVGSSGLSKAPLRWDADFGGLLMHILAISLIGFSGAFSCWAMVFLLLDNRKRN
jgi:hypothetical protein